MSVLKSCKDCQHAHTPATRRVGPPFDAMGRGQEKQFNACHIKAIQIKALDGPAISAKDHKYFCPRFDIPFYIKELFCAMCPFNDSMECTFEEGDPKETTIYPIDKKRKCLDHEVVV